MVDLAAVKDGGAPVMTTAKSSVSESDYTNLGRAFSGAADAVSGALTEFGKPIVEEQARRDVASMISRDENGNITLQDRPHPLIVGALGEVYTKTAETAFHLNIADALQTKGQELAALTNKPASEGGGGGDPDWFRQQMDPFVKGLASQARGGAQFDVLQVGQQISGEYYRHLVGQRAAMDGQAARSTFDASMSMLQTDLADLASQGGNETPEFRAKAEALQELRRQKLADPRMGYTKAQYDEDVRSDSTNQQVQGIVGTARRRAEATGDYFTPVRDAEAALQQVPMDPGKRIQLLGEITRHLGSAGAVRGQMMKELADDADGMAKAIYDTHSVDDGATNSMIARLVAARAFGPAMRLEAAREFTRMEPALLHGTAEQAASVMKRAMEGALTGGGRRTPVSVDDNGQKWASVSEIQQTFASAVRASGLVGTIPPDGPAHGIRTGSAAEWVNFMMKATAAESAVTGGRVRVNEKFREKDGAISEGLLSFSKGDLGNYPQVAARIGLAGQKSFTQEQMDDPDLQARFAAGVFAENIKRRGSIRAGVGATQGPISRGEVDFSGPLPQIVDFAGVAPAQRELVTRLQEKTNGRVEQLWGGMKQAWDAGNLPTPQEIADLKTLLPYYSKADGRQEIARRLQIEAATEKVAAFPGPVREDLAAAAKIAAQTGQLDLVGRETAARLQQAVKTKDDMLRSNPVGYTATYLQGGAPTGIPPLDFSAPDALRGSIAERQKMAGIARTAEPTAGANPFTPTDRQMIADVLPKMDGRTAGATLGTLASTLKPEEMQEVLRDDGIRSAVVGLTKSGDPAKMAAGFGFLDAQNRRNPMLFAATFGEEAERALHVWQAKSQFQPPDVVAKQMMTANDPSSIKARQELERGADDLLKGVVADDVVKRLATHPWFTWVPGDQRVFGFNPGEPMSSGPAMSPAELLADYRQAFRDGYSETGDRKAAETFAAKQVAKKWGPSPTNGGRLMAYPPERYVEPVNGDHAWMAKQLDDDIRSVLGVTEHYAAMDPWAPAGKLPTTGAEAKAIELYTAPRALVADAQTVADIEAGKVPSYRVVVRDREGLLHLMEEKPGGALRWRPDRAAATGAAEAGFRAGREAKADREGWFSGGGNGAIGNALFGLVMGGGM